MQDDGLMDRAYEVLIKYSANNELSYFFAVEILKKELDLDNKAVRKILRDMFFEGYWEWSKEGKIRLREPISCFTKYIF